MNCIDTSHRRNNLATDDNTRSFAMTSPLVSPSQPQTSLEAIARHAQAAPGERALLLYAQGLDFLAAFLGCLRAGVIAVPAYPPRKNRKLERLVGIVENCSPTVLLTTEEIRSSLPSELTDASMMTVLTTDMPVAGLARVPARSLATSATTNHDSLNVRGLTPNGTHFTS